MDERVTEFAHLMRRLRNGDVAAFDIVYARYGDAIRHVVRQKLHDRLRAQFDSLDFVQDVWTSFVALPAVDFTFDTPDALGRFLTQIARHKVIELFRSRFETQTHDINREQPLGRPTSHGGLTASEPSPSQLAIAQEQWDEMVKALPEGHRAILERLREGYTHEEIAELAGVNVRTVERVVRRLKGLCGM